MGTVLRHARVAMALGAALGAAVACRESSVSGPGGAGANAPSVGATAQALGFSVSAQGFSFEQNYPNPTTGDSLAIGLAVTGYAGGSALIEIFDATGATRFQQTVTQNIAQGQTTVHGSPPYRVHLRFTGFTGVFALGVGVPAP
jgi:hypothetical protein